MDNIIAFTSLIFFILLSLAGNYCLESSEREKNDS